VKTDTTKPAEPTVGASCRIPKSDHDLIEGFSKSQPIPVPFASALTFVIAAGVKALGLGEKKAGAK